MTAATQTRFRFKAIGDDRYSVAGHPEFPDFTFAKVRKTDNGWLIESVVVGEAPWMPFRTRQAAADAALAADRAERAESRRKRTCDVTATLAIINALMRIGRSEGHWVYVEEITQVTSDVFRIRFNRETAGGDIGRTIYVDRDGQHVAYEEGPS